MEETYEDWKEFIDNNERRETLDTKWRAITDILSPIEDNIINF